MKKSNKSFFLFALLSLIPILSFGQGVTTSTITGVVRDAQGQPLIGATVVALHVPSGTSYGAASDETGAYRIPNMRVGGPYTITASYIGYASSEVNNLTLRLGEAQRLDFTLSESSTELDEITVTASSSSAGTNAGASTQISNDLIEIVPTLDNDIDDILKLTPQAQLYGDGISFAGINNRFNAIYIDGAVNNDVFGLASSGTNGGQTGASPFSLDILDQLQVVLSPYDVTLGGFAGGGINAVTKSGTNTFKSTAYTYIRNQNLVAKTNQTYANRLDIEREKVDEFTQNTTGFSVGGPIKKDKAFFFTNVEIQNNEVPVPFDLANYTRTAGRYTESDLTRLRNHLINTYGYDPGTFGNTSDNLEGLKIFGKIDYNLNSNNRLTLRHQFTKAEQFDRYAGSSNTINFSNNGIYFPSTTNSTALELNTVFGTNASNNLILSFVTVRDDRDPLGGDFPYVYIEDVSGGLIRFGSEEFSTGNALDQDIFTITNNFKLYRGNHTFTIGTHNEFYSIYNLFIRQNYGTYRFASLDDFINGNPAKEYDRSFSLVDNLTGDGSKAASEFNAFQLGFYVQDEINVNSQLTVTAGLRLDIPVITDDPRIPADFNSTSLPLMQAGYDIAKNTVGGKAPEGQLMFSPRVGFTYDMGKENKQVLRGGIGIFTSRIPFVWPGAMFNNNGVTIGGMNENQINGDIIFRPDVNNQYTTPPGSPSGQIDLFTKDFKYPQVLRGSLGFDFILPGDIEATVEALYTKTLNNILYTNINSKSDVAFTWTGTPDNRKVYTRSSYVGAYGSGVYLASNTSEGYGYNLTARFAKRFNFGLAATLAYSFGDSYSVSEGTSSQNSSQWRGQVSIDGRNNPVLGRSDFAQGHRVISSFSYKKNWSNKSNNATTFSLFMNGGNATPFSYIIAGSNGRNLNNEAGSTSRNRSLIYIPENSSDINLVDYTAGGVTVTAAQQWERLNAVIEDDRYLKNNRGGYAEKNGAWMPFATSFDLSIKQDFGFNVGGQSQRIQVSMDVINFANLINPNWGTVYTIPGDFNNYFLYQFEGYEADGTTPKFTFRGDGSTGKDRFNISNSGSRWQMRFGVRYMFN